MFDLNFQGERNERSEKFLPAENCSPQLLVSVTAVDVRLISFCVFFCSP